jgi:hypothetical protein
MLHARVKMETAKKKGRSFSMPAAVTEPAKTRSRTVCIGVS